ncbi:MAG TPA: DUF2723 domain-containing protein, partial [Bacteroidota bacterium]|nr:DUF2723 domain-containing protein [Bacteroidota bacterium]
MRSYTKYAVPAALGIVVAILYANTAARTVVFIDSGELSTVAWTLGVAHPTGYPLYTMLAWTASHLPLPLAPVFKLNLLSSFLSLSAVVVFYGFLRRLAATRLAFPKRPDRPPPGPETATAAGAIFGAATLAFSETFWSGSTAAEVYPLHALFLVTLLWLFLEAFLPPDRKNSGTSSSPEKTGFLFAFTLGLAFTNHLSTLYLAPALLFTYFRIQGISRRSLALLARLAPAFLLGLTPYLYLPLRASSMPLMDWGNTTGWDAIVRHLSGRQYSVWIFSSSQTAERQLGYFFSNLGPEYLYIPLALGLWGMRFLFSRDRTLFYFILLLFLGCLFFAVNYDINDIDSYFFLAYIAVAAAAGTGAYAVLSRIPRPGRTAAMIAGVLALGFQAGVMYPRVDQSGLRVVEQYTRSILGSVEDGSLVLSYQWDYFVSASYYLRYVEGYRPDVAVVDKELLRRSWYIGSLRRRYPALMDRVEPATRSYLAELFKFEKSLPYDPRVIEYRYTQLIAAIVAARADSPGVYVTPEIEQQYTQGYERIPHGLTFRLVKPGKDPAWREVPLVIDSPPPVSPYIDGITMLAAQA